MIVLSVILTAAVLCGVVYELCRRRMNRGNLSTVNVCGFKLSVKTFIHFVVIHTLTSIWVVTLLDN